MPGGSTNNVASIAQGSNVIGFATATSVTAVVSQESKDNSALLSQVSTGHVLTVNQTSLGGASIYGNSVSVSQLGDTNTGTVNQTIATGATGNNVGTLTQNGTGNFGTITQGYGTVAP